MNFPRTIISVCSGTSGFPAFLEVAPLRAFVHLALLLLIASIFIAVCRFFPTQSDTSRICSVLSDNFGDMRFEPNGIFPSKAISVPLTIILSSQARLDYFPSASSVSLAGMDEWKSLGGVIWTPESIVGWLRSATKDGEGVYVASPIIQGDRSHAFDSSAIGKGKLEALVRDAKWSGAKQPVERLSFTQMASVFGILITAVFFGTTIVLISVFTVLVISFFAAVQYMWVSGLSPKLRLGNILTISVYSAFPAIMIASLVPAFDLPFLSFPLVFFLCFFIYHMVAFSTIQKFLTPPSQQKPSSWDDDDGF